MILSPNVARAGEGDRRLPAELLPLEQLVELDLDPAKLDYSGRVRLTVRLTAPSPRIPYHSVGHQFQRTTLLQNGQPIAASQEITGPQRAFVQKTPFPAGTYVIDLAFSGKLSTQSIGMYRATVDGQSYILTQFESDYARAAFPCLDEPGAKFPYQIVVRVPKAAVVVSNTPIEKESTQGDHRLVTFKKTPPLSSYLLALAVGPFDSVPIEGMSVPGRVYTQKGKAAYAVEVAKAAPLAVGSLEKYFGRKYPYDKLDFIAAPEFLFGGMENPGAIVYRDSAILLRPEDVTQESRNRLLELVSHEIAHIWFGDLVTMRWWDDLWLNESFASWMESKVMDDVAPELRASLHSVRIANQALLTDSRRTTRAMRKPVQATDNFETLVDELTYNKGQAVLEMFESYLGRAKFQNGVNQYLHAFAWKNTAASDLWTKLGEATGVDVGRAMSTFLDQPGAPLVTVTRLGKGRVSIEQKRLGGGSERWIIPVVLKYADGKEIKTQTLLLDQPRVELDLAAKNLAFVHPNYEERGYYRWLVGPEDWKAILERAPVDLTVRERLGLLTNATALFRLGLLDGERLLRAIERLADDGDFRVQANASQTILELRPLFDGTKAERGFTAYGLRLHKKMLARLQPQPRAGEKADESSLRGRLLAGACAFGDAASLERGRKETKAYLADPKAVHPTLVDAILECGATVGDRALFDTFRQRFEQADAPRDRARYLAALGGLGDPTLLQAVLEYTATGPLRPHEMLRPLQNMGWTEARRRMIYAFVKARYAELAKRIPDTFRAFIPQAVLPPCDRAALADGKAFFTDAQRKLDGVEQNLARVEDSVEECQRVRDSQLDLVDKLLGGAGGKNRGQSGAPKSKKASK